jgi:hypothetical protein
MVSCGTGSKGILRPKRKLIKLFLSVLDRFFELCRDLPGQIYIRCPDKAIGTLRFICACRDTPRQAEACHDSPGERLAAVSGRRIADCPVMPRHDKYDMSGHDTTDMFSCVPTQPGARTAQNGASPADNTSTSHHRHYQYPRCICSAHLNYNSVGTDMVLP